MSKHYKRMPLIGLTIAILSLGPLAIWPASMPTVLVLLLLTLIGAGLGTVFPVSTVVHAERGVAHADGRSPPAPPISSARCFPRWWWRCWARSCWAGSAASPACRWRCWRASASANELAYAFRFVFLACALVLTFGLAFLISMEERPLKGPSAPSQGATAPSGPATPIPAE